MNNCKLDIFETLEYESPFDRCKLDRKSYALVLTNIIKLYPNGFVLGLNNSWGTGKTTFVKMWKKHLCDLEKFKTIYINAWENDFQDNIMISILAEFEVLINANKNDNISSQFSKLIEKSAPIIKNITSSLVLNLIKNNTGLDLTNAFNNDNPQNLDIIKSEISEFNIRKKNIIEFKAELTKIIEEISPDKAVVIFIDELDRCRPDYAVKYLENIKHFFNIKGLTFVLSIDKEQLKHSIEGVYGSNKINSEEYLRRFIDIEYSLPFPNPESFCKYLYDYFNFEDYFKKHSDFSREFLSDKGDFLRFANILIGNKKIELRVIEKIFAQTRIALDLFQISQYILPELLFFLIYLKVKEKDIYTKINDFKYDLDSLVFDVENIFSSMEGFDLNIMLNVEAMLIITYVNAQDKNYKNEIIIENNKIMFKSKYNEYNSVLFNHLNEYLSKFLFRQNVPITHILNKINFLVSDNQ